MACHLCFSSLKVHQILEVIQLQVLRFLFAVIVPFVDLHIRGPDSLRHFVDFLSVPVDIAYEVNL